ncbi:MAG: sulfatase-like hydrolase/transferase [Phycisphaerales bacterium]|nr:sulfatase-like hydrolase/transferase [Phycisphaerales bacterium]
MSKKPRTSARQDHPRSAGSQAESPQSPAPPARRRAPHKVILAVAVLVAALATAYLTLRARPAARETLNVVLISLDTTRADHLGCYGHPTSITPNINRLAAEGTLFTQCTTVAPSTLPSHASLLTGTYPFIHGARVNGNFELSTENQTLAETLKAAGFVTGAQTAAMVLNREYGLNQGFDVYLDPRALTAERPKPSGGPVRERKATDIADRAMQFVREHREERFFLFLHFFDPHQPLDPPEPLKKLFPNDPYLGEIAYVDQQIGRICKELETLKLDGRTLIVLTADHGESREEHGEENHGLFVYDSTLLIPLILRCPGWIPAGGRVDAQVRLVDIAPTILDLTGVKIPGSVSGATLAGLIRGEVEPGRPAYSETLASLYDYGYAPLRSLRQDGWKYILGPKPELYHLASDPKEAKNLIEAQPQRAAAMRADLEKLISSGGAGIRSSRRQPSPQERSDLAGLGYVSLHAPEDADPDAANDLQRYPVSGLNPMERAEEIKFVNGCITLCMARRYPEAERRLRSFLSEHADRKDGLYNVYKTLANTLDGMGKPAESIEFYEKAVAERPDDVITLTDMGIALHAAGRVDEAIATFRRALAQPLDSPYTHLQLGAALATKGDDEGAVKEYLAALQADPQIAAAHAALATIYAKTNRKEEALAAIQRAVELNPLDPSYKRRLEELTAPAP